MRPVFAAPVTDVINISWVSISEWRRYANDIRNVCWKNLVSFQNNVMRLFSHLSLFYRWNIWKTLENMSKWNMNVLAPSFAYHCAYGMLAHAQGHMFECQFVYIQLNKDASFSWWRGGRLKEWSNNTFFFRNNTQKEKLWVLYWQIWQIFSLHLFLTH